MTIRARMLSKGLKFGLRVVPSKSLIIQWRRRRTLLGMMLVRLGLHRHRSVVTSVLLASVLVARDAHSLRKALARRAGP